MVSIPLSDDQVDALRAIDTPTITNAMDVLTADYPTIQYGFSSLELRCLVEGMSPTVGYAITCISDDAPPRNPETRPLRTLYEAIRDSAEPVVVVCQYVGADRLRSNLFGDVMATTFQRLGAVAAVTNGGIRDLAGIRERAPGFQMFAPGAVAAKGNSQITEVGSVVSICGLTIAPQDLLHGDANGLVSIPATIADKVARKASEVSEKEQARVDFIKSSRFTLEELAHRSGW